MKKIIITIIAAASIFFLGCGSDSGTSAASHYYYAEVGAISDEAIKYMNYCNDDSAIATCVYQAIKSHPYQEVGYVPFMKSGTKNEITAWLQSPEMNAPDEIVSDIWRLIDQGSVALEYSISSKIYIYVKETN